MALQGKKSIPSKEVEKIGKKMAKQCKGSPLVAKIVGGLLYYKAPTAQEWKQALDDETLRMENATATLVSNFRLSYQQLPRDLKACFPYCALFPKDTDIDVERLVRLWAAVGCISNTSREAGGERLGNEDMEKRGYVYFKDLKTRSFFGEAKISIHKNKISSCRIPGLQYLAMLDEKKKLDSSVSEDRKARCFLILSPRQVPQDLFERLKYLRALVLSCCQLEQLSSDVAKLTLLRYLDLSGNPLRQLPETVCNLILLESLDVHGCYLLLSLPQRIGELQRLRHLRMNHTTDELHYNLPQGFKRLAFIQTLDVFRAGGRRYGNIAKLGDLKALEDIRIVIHGEMRFEEAKLENKWNMENLELCFTGEGQDIEKVSFIQGLKPPPRLQMLKLEGYPGLKLPRWIVGVSLVHYLRRLSLKSALNISSLPALWKLAALEFLWLYDLPNLKHLGLEFLGLREAVHSEKKETQKTWFRELTDDKEISSSEDDEETTVRTQDRPQAFPKLETLRVEYLENWETWADLKENQISVMPHLKDLHIHGCPKLKSLPSFILAKRPGLSITAETKLIVYAWKDTGAEHSRDQQGSKH